ncbi:MAG TPA: efflux RND transporter permease subunit [Candidatus Binataceae bacterium]|nr:efflux RND transporter permease subunit [Candidatus Binataceae bacterium]
MWIVSLALRRPLSVAVMALLMLVLGALSFTRMNADIFPAIDMPVVIVVWNYPGLSAIDMERRVVIISERASGSTVNDIEHMESESIAGAGLIRIYFHPGTITAGGIAQLSSLSQSILSIFPPGIQAPNIVDYNAANVPVAQLNVSSDTLSEQALFDYGLNFIRVRLYSIEGISVPAPFGGRNRAVMVNLDPTEMYANGLSAERVGNALSASNIIIPAGSAKIGNREYRVELNGSPNQVEDFNRVPVKVVNGAPVYLGEVAPVTDTHMVQTNVVRIDGVRATYLPIFKHAAASTLTVIDNVRKMIPIVLETAPKGMKLKLAFDQSVFVRAALWGVVREATIAAGLVALMVLVFLGSPRSMLIVILSIPLSILTAIVALKLSGETINIMTLGGLALAVGMLVDDATVAIENIHRHHAMHKPLLVAILDGSSEIATPALIGTLAICIVFFPVVLLYGVARFLFTPLALAVVYAMLTSYLLSRTLVPAMARHLMPESHEEHAGSGTWAGFVAGFDRAFEGARERYRASLGKFIARRGFALGCVAILVVSSLFLAPVVGQDFFPYVDAGMMKMHLRAPTGTRVEQTELIVDDVERAIRRVIPAGELDQISDNIGLPPFAYVLAFYQTDSVGPQDADILISLKPGHHPTAAYQARIRQVMAREFPDVQVYFQAADIVSQVLNFGLSAPIDAQISGQKIQQDYAVAQRLESTMREIPGLTDVRIAQLLDYPTIQVNVDRVKALQLGIDQRSVATDLLTSLATNTLLAPNYWLDPSNGVNYSVLEQVPQHLVDSVQALGRTPLSPNVIDGTTSPSPQLLSNIATIREGVEPAVVNHYDVQRVIDVDCNVEGRDLGGSSAAVQRAIDRLGQLAPGMRINIRGQSQAMHESFSALELGLVLAIVLVYLLMVANFQSWVEPLVIMMAVPGALAGVLWMLALTSTTINVESLMGAIMAVGVGVANGNLVVIFANELREQGYTPSAAAIEAARTRLRPVVMTALAMILGMLPMALAIGEGGEQNAPLGRAVIGGLLVATLMTLYVVPAVYSIFARNVKGKHERDAELEAVTSPGA